MSEIVWPASPLSPSPGYHFEFNTGGVGLAGQTNDQWEYFPFPMFTIIRQCQIERFMHEDGAWGLNKSLWS
jgi:hypothetical protein